MNYADVAAAAARKELLGRGIDPVAHAHLLYSLLPTYTGEPKLVLQVAEGIVILTGREAAECAGIVAAKIVIRNLQIRAHRGSPNN